MMIGRVTGALALAALVAGCGGGGGGGLARLDAATYQERADWYNANADAIFQADLTDPSTLQATGSARYDGYAWFDLTPALASDDPAQNWLSGNMTATAFFGSDQVSSRISDLEDTLNGDWDGELVGSNGTIDRTVDVSSFYTIVSDLSGNLVAPDGSDYDVTGQWLGDFTGTYIRGETEADFTSSTAAPINSTGDFIIRRNP